MNAATIENGRAAYAFKLVEEKYMSLSQEDKEKYRSYIKKLPMMIKVNGLGQSLAFYYSNKVLHKDIYFQLEDWILKFMKDDLQLDNDKNNKRFIEIVLELDVETYRMVTLEVLTFLNWMRRFVDGLKNEGDRS